MKEHRPKFGLGHVKEFKFNIDRALKHDHVLKVPKRMDVLFWGNVCYMGIYNYLFREKDYVGLHYHLLLFTGK